MEKDNDTYSLPIEASFYFTGMQMFCASFPTMMVWTSTDERGLTFTSMRLIHYSSGLATRHAWQALRHADSEPALHLMNGAKALAKLPLLEVGFKNVFLCKAHESMCWSDFFQISKRCEINELCFY